MRNSKKRNKLIVIGVGVIIVIIMLMVKNSGDILNYKIHYENIAEANMDYLPSENSPNLESDDWNLILVNSSNYIPENYKFNAKTLKNDFQVDERIYEDLQEMFDEARGEEIYPLIGSAYRSIEKQQELFMDKINAYIAEGYSKKEAKALVEKWVAIPGTSEHHTGLALDINAEKDKSTNEEVYTWLNENSYKYGFIVRYPVDKTHITGINYEPWHYRYVGKEAAKEIYEKSICLEEYLDSSN